MFHYSGKYIVFHLFSAHFFSISVFAYFRPFMHTNVYVGAGAEEKWFALLILSTCEIYEQWINAWILECVFFLHPNASSVFICSLIIELMLPLFSSIFIPVSKQLFFARLEFVLLIINLCWKSSIHGLVACQLNKANEKKTTKKRRKINKFYIISKLSFYHEFHSDCRINKKQFYISSSLVILNS